MNVVAAVDDVDDVVLTMEGRRRWLIVCEYGEFNYVIIIECNKVVEHERA